MDQEIRGLDRSGMTRSVKGSEITLAIESAGSFGGSVALVRSSDARALGSVAISARGSREILGAIEKLLASVGAGKSAIDLIGVSVGPGSFTGIRVGIGFALGLARGLAIDSIGISTFDAIAESARESVPIGARLAIVAPSRRGAVFRADYRKSAIDSFERIGIDRVESEDDFISSVEPGSIVHTESVSIIERIRAQSPGSILRPDKINTIALGLARLALRERRSGVAREHRAPARPKYILPSYAEKLKAS